MSNIYPSILEKLAALNIDIYHYEDIVRCYALAKLNIEHSGNPDYTDGIHSMEFDAEAMGESLNAFMSRAAMEAMERDIARKKDENE